MYTDWTQIDPHYFYWRGALWGAIGATWFWVIFIPWLKKRLG